MADPTRLLLKVEEAIALVKRSERERAHWCMHVRVDMPTVDAEGSPDGKVFPDGLSAWLDLSRADAIKLLRRSHSSKLEERGGRIAVTRHETDMGRETRITYWIGA